MLRTKLSLSRILPVMLPGFAACCALVVTSQVFAGPPRVTDGLEPDYEASGFVVPAGYNQPVMQAGGGVAQANAPYGPTPMYNVAQTGFFHGGAASNCDAGGCDGMCGGACGGGAMGGCGMCGGGGCGGCGLLGGGMSDLRHICIFCRGDGCGVCQTNLAGGAAGLLSCLAPYTEAGIGAQRWYDFSAEAVFLGMDADVRNTGITSNGIGGPIVLRTSDAYESNIQPGMRFSGSMICGAGGNLEATYMGVNHFDGSAFVTDPAPTYYSFISQFGNAPPGGYDDTDASLYQGVQSQSRFHTGEVNYRRRWVGPYSRFQGSWLAGFRYVDFDDRFELLTVGLNNDTLAADDLRFFRSRYKVSNQMPGFQLGGDLWWNIYPGINLGTGFKGALLGNTAKRTTVVESNSLTPGSNVLVSGSLQEAQKTTDSAMLFEMDVTLLYRISYSWTVRSSYYFISLEEVGLGATGLESTTFVNSGAGIPEPTLSSFAAQDDVTFQGFSFGLEYLW